MTIRVLIADDQDLVREGFRLVLEREADVTVVGDVGDGRAAVERARLTKPDVVLMDVRMPHVDGIEATQQLLSRSAVATRVLILTTFDLDEYVYAALRAGASGFLLKDASPEHLVEAVRVVARGDALLAPQVTRRLVAEYARRPRARIDAEARFASLTPREREVFELIARGLTNRDIVETLVVSEATVKTHVNRLLTKLQARDRIQLVILAYESGIVVPGEDPPEG